MISHNIFNSKVNKMNLDIHVHCNSGDPEEVRIFVENSEKNDNDLGIVQPDLGF